MQIFGASKFNKLKVFKIDSNINYKLIITLVTLVTY